MATPEINENCHYLQNDPHRCKIKPEKFHFDILCCFEVIKESLPGSGIRPVPPGEIGLNNNEHTHLDRAKGSTDILDMAFMTLSSETPRVPPPG